MYLEQIELTNIGPIENVKINCDFPQGDNPSPLVIVGKNGSGKSILLAHIVSAMIDVQSQVFEDADVDSGKVYKLRSPIYVRHGSRFSVGKLSFTNQLQVSELQLLSRKKDFEGTLPNYDDWEKVGDNDTSHYSSNMNQENFDLKAELDNAIHLYFPPNRFEEPAWLNELNLKNKVEYFSKKNILNLSNRPVVKYAPLREVQSWLLDLIYDSYARERIRVYVPKNEALGTKDDFVTIENGPASKLLNAVANLLLILFDKEGGALTWDVGPRSQRRIGILIDEEVITSNLFGLSTGQVVILDLFLTLLRDFDLSYASFEKLEDIQGIVVVDEVDMHLHSDFQHDLLPRMMKLFPKVQFILTTHSPLFLMGMQKHYTADGFQLIELPSGQEIEVERFSEFEVAYKHMQDSARYQDEIREKISATQKPILVIEDEHDAIYKIAFLKTRDIDLKIENYEALFDKHASFVIHRGGGARGVSGLLRMNFTDTFNDKKIIGLFDFDKEGTECFYHLKKGRNWDNKISGNKETGKYKKRNQHGCFYALLIPVPDRHHGVIADIEDGNFSSFVEIENLLPDDFLTKNELVDARQITGTTSYNKIRGNKKSTLDKLLVNADPSTFNDFKPLYKRMDELFGDANS